MEIGFPSTPGVGRIPNMVISIGDSRRDADYLNTDQLGYGARSQLIVAKALLGQRFIVGPGLGKSGDRTDQTLARMLGLLPTASASVPSGDPRATKAKICYIQDGVNNIAQTATGFTYVHAVTGETVTIGTVAAVTARDLRQISDLCLAAGMIVVMENEVGANGLSTQEKVTALVNLRQAIREYGEATPGVYVHDAFTIITNPTFSASAILLKPTYVYDVTHPNALGAYLWGKSLAALLSSIIPASSRGPLLIENIVETQTANRRQLLLNPLFATGTGGTVGSGFTSLVASVTASLTSGSNSMNVTAVTSGTLAVGQVVTGTGIPAGTTISALGTGTGGTGTYTLSANATATNTGVAVTVTGVPLSFGVSCIGSATATATTAANANGIGNEVTIAATFTGNGDAARINQSLAGTSANGGTYNAQLQVGDIVQAVAQVDITGTPVNLSTLYLSLVCNKGGGDPSPTSSFDMFSANATVDYGINEACTLTLATRPFALPAPTGTFPFLTAEVRAAPRAAGSATFVVRQFGIFRRDTVY